MEKRSAPPTELVNPLAEMQSESPEWMADCRICGGRADEHMPVEICATCALRIYHHIESKGRYDYLDIWYGNAERRAAELRASSVVYYARRGGMIKIGTTGDFHKRMAELLPDEVLAVEPGGRDIEQGRHVQFAYLRRKREWFLDDAALREHINELVAQHGPPPPTTTF